MTVLPTFPKALVSTVLGLFILAGSNLSAKEGITPIKSLDESALDKKADPCVDFYQFACGGWIAKAEIPADKPAWSRGFLELQKQNEILLNKMLEEYSKPTVSGSTESSKKLGDYYSTCMDEKKAETASPATLKEEMKKIDKLRSPKDVANAIGLLHRKGVDAFFEFGAMQDLENSSKMIGAVDQGGLSLPDRDYYVKDDAKMAKIRKQFTEYVEKMWKRYSGSSKGAKGFAQTILRIETEIARYSQSREERRDPRAIYHRLEMAGLKKTAPRFLWTDFFTATGYHGGEELNISSPEFFAAMDNLLGKLPMSDVKTYLKWHLLARSVPTMGKALVDEQFQFQAAAFTGQKEIAPRWKRCVRSTEGGMGELLGKEFVARHFTESSKAQARQLISQIEKSFEDTVDDLDWMDKATKKEALAKLKKIVNQVGYPDKWRDYSNLKVGHESYLANSFAVSEFEYDYDLSKIGKPVDRMEWHITPPTINAYYSQENNQMVFPAGILQAPFFDNSASPAANYGGIGVVMGHELTHGFDDEGRKFDSEGNLRDWWAPKVNEEFTKRAECVRDQYSNYVAIDDIKLNGKLTLGENIADHGGIRLAYLAYKNSKAKKKTAKWGGFNADHQFFLGFAQAWCNKMRPEFQALLATVDPHSPAKYRVNGTVSQFPEFAKAFECKAGKPMAPEKHCEVW